MQVPRPDQPHLSRTDHFRSRLSHPHQSILARQKPLQKLLQDRLYWLDEYGKLMSAHKTASSPESNPEHQAAQAKSELANLNGMLTQATGDSRDALTPLVSQDIGKGSRRRGDRDEGRNRSDDE